MLYLQYDRIRLAGRRTGEHEVVVQMQAHSALGGSMNMNMNMNEPFSLVFTPSQSPGTCDRV
jgi:hypothetical protein